MQPSSKDAAIPAPPKAQKMDETEQVAEAQQVAENQQGHFQGLFVENLKAAHGHAPVLFGLNFHVLPGEAVALIGPNGAGKSSTLMAVMGLLRILEGRILWRGQEIQALPTHLIARKGIGWVPEDRRIFPDLTVAENVLVGRKNTTGNEPYWTDDKIFDVFPKLKPLWQRRAGFLSGGEQQMLSVARTLAGEPKLLLLDEPAEGLAPVVVQQMAEAIQNVKAHGLSILLSEQMDSFANALMDRSYHIQQGVIDKG